MILRSPDNVVSNTVNESMRLIINVQNIIGGRKITISGGDEDKTHYVYIYVCIH